MAKFTELFSKKLDRFLGTEHTIRESAFIQKHILTTAPAIQWVHGISLSDTPRLCDRCHSFGGRVIGVETHLESPYPFYTFLWSDFCQAGYSPDWIDEVCIALHSRRITTNIVVIMDFPESVINLYL